MNKYIYNNNPRRASHSHISANQNFFFHCQSKQYSQHQNNFIKPASFCTLSKCFFFRNKVISSLNNCCQYFFFIFIFIKNHLNRLCNCFHLCNFPLMQHNRLHSFCSFSMTFCILYKLFYLRS